MTRSGRVPLNAEMVDGSRSSVHGHASFSQRFRTATETAGSAFARALRPPPVWAVVIVCAITGAHTGLRWSLTAAHLHLDAMVYYGAAQLGAAGRIDVIFDPARMTEFLNQLFFADSEQLRLFLAPWLYPPIFLLALVPLAPLPFVWFYGLFQALTAGLAALALSRGKGPMGRLGTIALLTSPAAVISIISGQNALLSLALLVGGCRLLSSRPFLAGALLGALVYKPQLAILVPFALIGARAWRSLVAAVGSALLLVMLSAAAFGMDAWTAWLAQVLHPPGNFGTDWLRDSVMRGYGVYVCALRLGAPSVLAMGIQFVSAAISAAVVYLVYRKPGPWQLRLAVVLCGTALVTPHLAPYDLVLVSCAVVLLFARSFPDGFMPGEALVLALGWVIPVLRPADALIGAFAPVVIAVVAAYAIAKMGLATTASDFA